MAITGKFGMAADKNSGNEAKSIDRLGLWIGLAKVALGTALVGSLGYYLPYKINLLNANNADDISSRNFVSTYIEYLEKDPSAQLALVNYFAYVLPAENDRKLWRYYKFVLENKEKRADEIQLKLYELQEGSLNPLAREKIALQFELNRIRRETRAIVPLGDSSLCTRSILREDMVSDYRKLWPLLEIEERFSDTINQAVMLIKSNKSRYQDIIKSSRKSGASTDPKMPWYVLGIVHYLDSNVDFDRFLPVSGMEELSEDWDVRATQFLESRDWNKWVDWTLTDIMFRLEQLNGNGYRNKGRCSPYIWSYTNHYKTGTYVANGVFEPQTRFPRAGVAVLLKEMLDQKLVKLKIDLE